MVRYHDLVFQPDMLTAKRDDGTILRLTRQERALLLRFVRQPQELVARAQLLEALGDETGTLSERNVDCLVNRLRKRLGDSTHTEPTRFPVSLPATPSHTPGHQLRPGRGEAERGVV